MTARDILRMLAPVIGEERTNRLWRAYLISDVKERRDLECMFEAYAALALRDVPSGGAVGLFPPPPPERALGDIDLGHIRYAGKDSFLFGLKDEEAYSSRRNLWFKWLRQVQRHRPDSRRFDEGLYSIPALRFQANLSRSAAGLQVASSRVHSR